MWQYRLFWSGRPPPFGAGAEARQMKLPQPWTSEDEARLRELAASGRSVATIAERLQRTRAAIRYKARSLNISLPRAERGWKAKVIRMLSGSNIRICWWQPEPSWWCSDFSVLHSAKTGPLSPIIGKRK
jgi:hypothetical protein